MKGIYAAIMLLYAMSAYSSSVSKFVSIDKDVYHIISDELSFQIPVLFQNKSSATIRLTMPQIEELSNKIHLKLRRCGGFIVHDSLAKAKGTTKAKQNTFNLVDYAIDQHDILLPMLEQVSEEEIRKMILLLSSFENRHYLSESGTKSSNLISDVWSKLTAHRSDTKIESFVHKNWPQPTIILTIEGSENPEEIIVLGGHADSIAMDGIAAPGADDNASGISSITEVIRLLMVNNFRPKKTLQFMAYAAEEVGLLGSQEVAKNYRNDEKQVLGVMQLDMTLFKGLTDKDIILMSDYTNHAQNAFLGNLIDVYVKVPWGFSTCGYGCSDHASWTDMGYPASFPFESTLSNVNPHIHTFEDTLERAGGTANHAVNFTKLATAFVVEMTN